MRIFILIFLLGVQVSLDGQNQQADIPIPQIDYDIENTDNTWIVKLIDSIRYKTNLCSTTITPPVLKVFRNTDGSFLYRLRYAIDENHAYIQIYEPDGSPRAHCQVTPEVNDCDSYSEYTNYAFSDQIMTIWTCSDGYNCDAKRLLGLSRKFDPIVHGDRCLDPERLLSSDKPFPSYNWYKNGSFMHSGPTYSAKTSGEYALEVIDQDNCTIMKHKYVHVHEPIKIPIIGDTFICPGSSTTVRSEGFERYSWSTGSTETSTMIEKPGNYQLTVLNVLGCESTVDFEIKSPVNRSIDIYTNRQPYVDEVIPIELQLNNLPPSHIESLEWFTEAELSCYDCLETYGSLKTSTYISAMVIDHDGCIYETEDFIRVNDQYKDVVTANVFSPDGDGKNDLFSILSEDHTIKISDIIIYNRWGQVVHHQSNYPINDQSMGWDGTKNGIKAPSDLYVYLVEIEYANGVRKKITGDILLIR